MGKCLRWACCQKNNPNNSKTTVRLTAILPPLEPLPVQFFLLALAHVQQGTRPLNYTLVIFHGKSLDEKFKGAHITKLTHHILYSLFFFFSPVTLKPKSFSIIILNGLKKIKQKSVTAIIILNILKLLVM